MKFLGSLLAVFLLCTSTPALAVDVVTDVSGFRSMEFEGDALNDVLSVDLGAAIGAAGSNVDLNTVSWDLILTTYSPSWGDEPRIGIDYDGDSSNDAYIGPFGSATTVTSANLVGGPLALGGVTIVGGVIDLEFFETGFNDFAGAPDALYGSNSTLTFDVSRSGDPIPEPATIALLLMGLGVLGYKRFRL